MVEELRVVFHRKTIQYTYQIHTLVHTLTEKTIFWLKLDKARANNMSVHRQICFYNHLSGFELYTVYVFFSCKGKKEEPWWVNFFLLPVLNFFFSLVLFPSFSFYVSMKILLSFSHKDSGGLYHFLIQDRLELEKRTLIYLNKCYYSLKLFLVVKIESR